MIYTLWCTASNNLIADFDDLSEAVDFVKDWHERHGWIVTEQITLFADTDDDDDDNSVRVLAEDAAILEMVAD